jgi:FlaA1/EpsC-like NDP-sugar epimerase/lipopolysaccharide/colanic/teichoic acid biosynthesis glycosyltransferase
MSERASREIRIESDSAATSRQSQGSTRAVKRGLDICLAAIAIVVTAPAIAFAFIAVRFSAGPGSIFARVPRLGESAKPIMLFKLRTLRESCGVSRTESPLAQSFSRAVRATRLDELPLLFNVLRGDLSLVGPASVDPGLIDWRDPVQHRVFTAKPGLTGLAQVARLATDGSSQTGWQQSTVSGDVLRLDSYYLDHQSLWLDLRIVARALGGLFRSATGHVLGASIRRVGPRMVGTLNNGTATRLRSLRGRHLFVFDVGATALTIYVVFGLRSTAGLAGSILATFLPAVLLPLFVRPPINVALGLYRRLWRHASVPELLVILKVTLTGTIVAMLVFYLVLAPLNVPGTASFPRSFWVLEGLLCLSLVAAPRLAIRALAASDMRVRATSRPSQLKTLLYGAGSVGAMIARSAEREPHAGVQPVGFLDDNAALKGKQVAGLSVYGGTESIADAVTLTGANVLLITMPAASGTAVRRVAEAGLQAGLEVRTVPPIHELFDGSVDAFRVRRVRVEDLIRRAEVSRVGAGVETIVRDRVVLITGAGGSIGSELARQTFAMRPHRLVLVDRAESALYNIQRELEDLAIMRHSGGDVSVHLADVASRAIIDRVITAERPDVILHAAANKHVPLMESHPSEAVQVNVGGTMAVLDAAVACGTPKFVLVSTDKAVTPSSTMGATKRVAEWLVADAARRTGRGFVSVRFGNVLGSAGSVLPIFQAQLEQGRPLTITDPEMTRYFMTIPEASSLILEALALGGPGDTFVLDMGDPVKIVDLARDLVRLAGRDPDSVPMVFTGLRPGEKLHEQLFYDHESARLTSNPKVMLAKGDVPRDDIRDRVRELIELANGAQDELLRDSLFSLVVESARHRARGGAVPRRVAVGPGRGASVPVTTT